MTTLPTHESASPTGTEKSRPEDVKERAQTVIEEASIGRLTSERRERVRAEVVSAIPWWYVPWGHLAGTTGIGLAVLAISITRLTGAGSPAFSDWLVVPAVLVFANFFEWAVHKHVLHKRRWPMQAVYDQHTPMHHMVYVENDMALRSSKEFRLVLIPAAGVLGIVISTTPLAIAIGVLWSWPAGWLCLVTASLYMVGYELLHLAYHAPAQSFVGRQRVLHMLRAHHARHHDPRLMQKWNFNVTIPLADWVLRTIAPKEGKK